MFDVTNIFKGDFVEITLNTSESLYGVVINVSGDYLALKEYVDFHFSGYKFIANAAIANVVIAQPVELFKNIVKQEKFDVIENGYHFLVEINQWDQLIKEIFNQGLICIFHLDKDTLYLGRLISGDSKKLSMICIDSEFKYEKRPHYLDSKDVSMIELGSAYTYILEKYSASQSKA